MDRILYTQMRLVGPMQWNDWKLKSKYYLHVEKIYILKENVVCHAQGRNTAFTLSNETSLTCCNTQETFLIKFNYKNKFIQWKEVTFSC